MYNTGGWLSSIINGRAHHSQPSPSSQEVRRRLKYHMHRIPERPHALYPASYHNLHAAIGEPAQSKADRRPRPSNGILALVAVSLRHQAGHYGLYRTCWLVERHAGEVLEWVRQVRSGGLGDAGLGLEMQRSCLGERKKRDLIIHKRPKRTQGKLFKMQTSRERNRYIRDQKEHEENPADA